MKQIQPSAKFPPWAECRLGQVVFSVPHSVINKSREKVPALAYLNISVNALIKTKVPKGFCGDAVGYTF